METQENQLYFKVQKNYIPQHHIKIYTQSYKNLSHLSERVLLPGFDCQFLATAVLLFPWWRHLCPTYWTWFLSETMQDPTLGLPGQVWQSYLYTFLLSCVNTLGPCGWMLSTGPLHFCGGWQLRQPTGLNSGSLFRDVFLHVCMNWVGNKFFTTQQLLPLLWHKFETYNSMIVFLLTGVRGIVVSWTWKLCLLLWFSILSY